MVGTRRTNACETCRRRRVKCDEIKPVCGQCAIKGRHCTQSLPPKVMWARNGQLSTGCACIIPPDRSRACSDPKTKRELCLTHVNAATGGGLIPKHRLKLVAGPSSSPIDQLRHQFLDAYLRGPPGLRLSGYNPLLSDLPRYLGASKALDDASACLIQAHHLRSRGEAASGNAAYLMAIGSLQKALNSPSDARRSTTLCAVTLLTWTEVLGEERLDKSYVQHVGGLTALIKLLGPSCAQDDLAREVIYGAAGSIIMDSIMKSELCFLNGPRWSWVLSDESRYDGNRRRLIRILQYFSLIASLVVRVRSACKSDSWSKVLCLFEEAIHLRNMIMGSKMEIDSLLSGQGLETRQLKHSARVPITGTYWFKDPSTARAANMCWALTIYINNILICVMDVINQSDIGITALGPSEDDLKLESESLGKQILMSTAYVTQFAPVGSVYMRFPIYMAWGTLSPECKDWAVGELHKLNDGIVLEYHTPETLDWTSRFLCGQAIMSSGF